MLEHWQWFGEWSISCVGILSDWVIETVSSLCRAGKTTLTINDLKKHALKPDQRLRLETEARTGEFKIGQAKAKSEQELQQLLGKPQVLPSGSSNQPRAALETSGKCSFFGPIGVTDQQYQESGVWHVECQTCGARRSMKEVKDRQKFPSQPPRKTPPPKGELRWVLRESAWTLAEN